nr:hypothetical protein [Providencia rettgeri]
MNLDDEKVVKVVMEVGSAVFRLLDNTDTITKEMIIDELERYRKEVTNTVARRVKWKSVSLKMRNAFNSEFLSN